MNKVYVVGPAGMFRGMFERHGYELVDSVEEADFVQFTGGADVTPSYYGELPHYRTQSDAQRDAYEAAVYQQALSLDKVLLGVCRGAQLLNVLNGGYLFQHVDGHAIRGEHTCHSSALDEEFMVTSTHHQMMRPGLDGEVEGWCDSRCTGKEHMSDDGGLVRVTDSVIDVEVIYYSMTKTLCFQPHPEYYGAHGSEAYYFSLINHYFK